MSMRSSNVVAGSPSAVPTPMARSIEDILRSVVPVFAMLARESVARSFHRNRESL